MSRNSENAYKLSKELEKARLNVKALRVELKACKRMQKIEERIAKLKSESERTARIASQEKKEVSKKIDIKYEDTAAQKVKVKKGAKK